tara:strand:- start:234 stop:758 length:525 start_codon:yes stop_codon:yes gene_type:complete
MEILKKSSIEIKRKIVHFIPIAENLKEYKVKEKVLLQIKKQKIINNVWAEINNCLMEINEIDENNVSNKAKWFVILNLLNRFLLKSNDENRCRYCENLYKTFLLKKKFSNFRDFFLSMKTNEAKRDFCYSFIRLSRYSKKEIFYKRIENLTFKECKSFEKKSLNRLKGIMNYED